MTVSVTVECPDVNQFPLFAAIFEGRGSDVSAHIKTVEDLDQVHPVTRMSPMHFAAVKGHTTIGAFLAECGADVDLKDHHGNTPLHVAAQIGKVLFVRMLISAGVDSLVTNTNGDTALHIACRQGDAKLAELLSSYEKSSEDIPEEQRSVNVKNRQNVTPREICNSMEKHMVEALDSQSE